MAGLTTELVTDNAATTLNGAIATTPAAGTSETWTLTSTAAPLPQASSSATPPTSYVALVDNEQVTVTNVISATQVTVLRGANGTTTATHANGAAFTHVVSSGNLRRFNNTFDDSHPRHRGYLAWTYPPLGAAATLNTSATGRINLFRIWVPETITVTNLVGNITTAGATLTASQCFGGLYDSSGNLLKATADQSTPWTTTGLKTMALTATQTITGGPDVYVYAALLANGTTLPIWSSAAVNTTLINAGLAANTYEAMAWSTAQTTLPATITLSNFTTGVSGCIWLALS